MESDFNGNFFFESVPLNVQYHPHSRYLIDLDTHTHCFTCFTKHAKHLSSHTLHPDRFHISAAT